MRQAISIVVAAIALTGCAAIQGHRAADTGRMPVEAGLRKPQLEPRDLDAIEPLRLRDLLIPRVSKPGA